MYREFVVSKDTPHWNEFMPGDAFSYVWSCDSDEHHTQMRLCGGTISFASGNDGFKIGATYFVVSRRTGPCLPFCKDHYIFLGPGIPINKEFTL